MDSQVDINSCTDAWKYSKQGVRAEMRLLGHKHTNIQGHAGFHVITYRSLRFYRESSDSKYVYWCMFTC